MKKIMAIDVLSIEIPFRRAFAHALNAHRASRPQLIRVSLTGGDVGWGEAQPREYVTGETICSVRDTVRALNEEWQGIEVSSLESASMLLRGSPWRSHCPAAFAGIELALLDAVGRAERRNVTEVLGSVKTESLLYDGAVLGFLPASAFGMALMRVKKLGKRVIKLKVGRDGDQERIAATRKILGDGMRIVLDANGAWSADEAIQQIRSFERHRIDSVEQPVAREDIEGMALVRRSVAPPIIADESVCTLGDAKRLVAMKAADILNIRVGKCGGMLASLELIEYAREHGLGTNLGVMVGETGIAGTAGRLLAACAPDIRDREFDSSGNAELDVLREPLAAIHENRAPLPALRPGLGYEIDAALVGSVLAA